MKTRLILFFAFILSCSIAKAQDQIHMNNSEIIKAKVLEIGLDEIKYRDYQDKDSPVIVIPKSDVKYIRYENGSELKLVQDPYNQSVNEDLRKKTSAVKFEFFSPLTHNITFGYEHIINVGMNMEYKFGIIGPGIGERVNDFEKPSGVFFKAGPKFLIGQDFYQKGTKLVHALKGKYIKPEIIFNTYKINQYVYNYSLTYPQNELVDVRYTNIAVNIVFGKQHLLGKHLTLDYYFGVGYGLQSSNYKTDLPYDYLDYEGYSYSHLYMGKEFPMILSGGLTIGYLF
ncbi:MAG: hypothetical protein DWQ44_05365 [Bacteroidetes bacterium]|nr:MAG: hypothetical protein DWQ33_00950 [Bacteroidota bacterium]REK03451.1 MAG: hypothetical protein DWQ39_09640 [Bacteroidota bacterium]REK34756.1 MAG: hypothetical protein DWQ44_05365 [Bacteroidota bacterium]REK51366.1 MAG: hypothetical protein DWQ48_01790 [Bacteroidota bacterium]